MSWLDSMMTHNGESMSQRAFRLAEDISEKLDLIYRNLPTPRQYSRERIRRSVILTADASGNGAAKFGTALGTAWDLSTYAIQCNTAGGEIAFYINAITPDNLLWTDTTPSLRLSDSFPAGLYVPDNCDLWVVVTGQTAASQVNVNITASQKIESNG